MKQYRSKVVSSNLDAQTFGSQEPGNKVYFNELDAYFSCEPLFTLKGKRFISDIVPLFKVVFSLSQDRALVAFKAAAPLISKESREIGFELLGFDFMIDDSLNVWLIEVNQNPCLETHCPKQKELISSLLSDTFA